MEIDFFVGLPSVGRRRRFFFLSKCGLQADSLHPFSGQGEGKKSPVGGKSRTLNLGYGYMVVLLKVIRSTSVTTSVQYE